MIDQQNDGDAKAIERKALLICVTMIDGSTRYRAASAEDVAAAGFSPSSELEAVRLELEEAKAGAKDRWDRDTQRLSNLCEKLSAVESALTTERARVEEAEASVGVLDPQAARLTREHLRLGTELAAANAHAGRLEEALQKSLAAAARRIGELEEAIADVADGFEQQGKLGLASQLRQFLPPVTAPQASTEQASPSPAVGAAQPAPGGTERWVPKVHDVVRGSARKPRGCFEGSGVIVEIFDPSNPLPIHVKWDNGSRGNYAQVELEPLPGPTPAEPQGRPDLSECPRCGGAYTDEYKGPLCPPCDYVEQGRPEQAGDRVDQLRADIARAFRALDRGASNHQVAEILEGK